MFSWKMREIQLKRQSSKKKLRVNNGREGGGGHEVINATSDEMK